MNKQSIFTVTTIRHALQAGNRAVGFFHEFDSAEYALVNNILDIYEEGYYPYAVIEEIEPGFYAYPRKELWYHWNRETGKYEPCEKPERFQQIAGWSLG